MTTQLRDVTKDNWFAVTQLQISEENGKKFIVPIVYSIAESKYEKHLIPMAIFQDQILVGFTMYGLDPEDQNYWIYVYMIDRRYQRRGYGKSALLKLIEYIRGKHKVYRILIGHKPENKIAEHLYKSVGFRDTGMRINQEIIREICLG